MPRGRILVAAIVAILAGSSLVSCSGANRSRIGSEIKTYSLSANAPAAGNVHPSSSALEYAKELGGVAQTDKRLWVILGRTAETETEAQEALDAALPLFGDIQSYFIVQHSDGFEGLPLGQWVLIELYETPPSSESLELARRGFADAEVKEVTVRTRDPIPVYEQGVEQ